MKIRNLVRSFGFRAACFVALVAIPIVHGRMTLRTAFSSPVNQEQLIREMPSSVGPYKLVKTRTERQYSDGGIPMFVVGEYVTAPGADGQAEHMMLGLFVTSGYHRVVDSKAFQGQHPVWTAAIDGTLASSRPVHFGESFFDDGEKREFNAETVCSELDCTNPLVDYDRFSLSRYTGPRSGKHLPILLRSDFPEGVTATPELRARFEADVRKFSQGLDVASLLDRAGSPQDQ